MDGGVGGVGLGCQWLAGLVSRVCLRKGGGAGGFGDGLPMVSVRLPMAIPARSHCGMLHLHLFSLFYPYLKLQEII